MDIFLLTIGSSRYLDPPNQDLGKNNPILENETSDDLQLALYDIK